MPRLVFSGGTTLETIMPSTAAVSRAESLKALCSRMPHSSAVWSRTVLRRQCSIMDGPSKAPMVTLLLPTSSASSTDTSGNDQALGAIVLLGYREAGGGEP